MCVPLFIGWGGDAAAALDRPGVEALELVGEEGAARVVEGVPAGAGRPAGQPLPRQRRRAAGGVGGGPGRGLTRRPRAAQNPAHPGVRYAVAIRHGLGPAKTVKMAFASRPRRPACEQRATPAMCPEGTQRFSCDFCAHRSAREISSERIRWMAGPRLASAN